MKRIFYCLALICLSVLLFSCMTSPRGGRKCSRALYDYGIKSPEQLTAFFLSHNNARDRSEIYRLATYYVTRNAKTVAELTNTWAMDDKYGEKLERLLVILDSY